MQPSDNPPGCVGSAAVTSDCRAFFTADLSKLVALPDGLASLTQPPADSPPRAFSASPYDNHLGRNSVLLVIRTPSISLLDS